MIVKALALAALLSAAPQAQGPTAPSIQEQAAMKVQARQAEATLQQASGQISEDYGGLGGKAGSVVSLQSSISMSKAIALMVDRPFPNPRCP